MSEKPTVNVEGGVGALTCAFIFIMMLQSCSIAASTRRIAVAVEHITKKVEASSDHHP